MSMKFLTKTEVGEKERERDRAYVCVWHKFSVWVACLDTTHANVFQTICKFSVAAQMSHSVHTPLRGVEATKLLNHNELRPNIWKSDTEITTIMVNYGRAQSLLRHCLKTKADALEKETLISRLLMICELQTLISTAIISSLFTALLLLDTVRAHVSL